MKTTPFKLLILVAFFLVSGCVERVGYYTDGEKQIISLICDITWATEKKTYENGNTSQSTWNFKEDGTYTRTDIVTDKDGNEKKSNIYGRWSFGDPGFHTLYFGERHYWDIDVLNQDKFAFYDRNGEFGDLYMTREYTVFTPYQEQDEQQ